MIDSISIMRTLGDKLIIWKIWILNKCVIFYKPWLLRKSTMKKNLLWRHSRIFRMLTIKSIKNQDRVNVRDILRNAKLGVRNSRHPKTRKIGLQGFSLQTTWWMSARTHVCSVEQKLTISEVKNAHIITHNCKNPPVSGVIKGGIFIDYVKQENRIPSSSD